MIKKILSILIAVIMAFSVAQVAFAAEKFYDDEYECWLYKENGFIYELNEEEDYLWIKEYVGTGDTICIPKTLGGMSVNYWNIDAYMFADSNASAFSVDEDNESFSVKDGVLFSKDGTELIAYPNGKAGDSYDIPEGVEKLGWECFSYSSLKAVTFPSTLTYVDPYAFGESFDEFFEKTDGMIYVGSTLVGYSDENIPNMVFVKDGTEKILSIPDNKYSMGLMNVIVIPDSVKYIEDCCERYGFYMCGSKGSAAEKFAEENDIDFIVLGEGHTHIYFYDSSASTPPTCVSDGEAVFACPCGEKYSVTAEKFADAHDFDDDDLCIYCGISWLEYWHGGEAFITCDCRCHRTGGYHLDTSSFFGFFADLFFRIKLIIWHLTGTHQYCECGCRHY